MIRMLVSDEDGVDAFGTRPADRFESPQHFLAAEAGVNEESRTFRLKQRAVARAARGQNRYAERDETFLRVTRGYWQSASEASKEKGRRREQ
jgi:hypothetical protein